MVETDIGLSPDKWGMQNSGDVETNKFANLYLHHLKTIKSCESDDLVCASFHDNGPPVYLYGSDSPYDGSSTASFILADGTFVYFNQDDDLADMTDGYGVNPGYTGSAYAYFIADVNVANMPNQVGRDIFVFVVTKNGLELGGGIISR